MKTLKELKKDFVMNMTNELNNYLVDIKKLDKEEIIEKSYEISTRKELYKLLKNKNNYTRLELNVLSDYEYPLDSIRESINSYDTSTEVSLDNLVKDFLYNEIHNNIQYEMEQLEDNPNYDLIYATSEVLEEMDEHNLCENLKNKFEITRFCSMEHYKRIVTVKQIFDSQEDINYLYNFLTNLVNDKEFQSVKINEINDNIKEKMIKEVLPDLKSIVKEAMQINKKEKENYER